MSGAQQSLPPVTFTVDLEDPTERYAPDGRYVAMTRRILDLCDETGRKATFFTIGKVAQSAPQLIRAIAERGHEIAYHSHAHRSLTAETPARFFAETRADKEILEDLTGRAVVGFRAPRFSLTPQSAWALDTLRDLGFFYSSSIMPTGASLFGFPDAPRSVFTWPNGLVEFPLPVADVGKYRIPYLGGIYLYTMPFFAARGFAARAKADEVLWTYTHPYDFDREEKFKALPSTPLWISVVLWLARKRASKQIKRLLTALPAAPPLRERLPAPASVQAMALGKPATGV